MQQRGLRLDAMRCKTRLAQPRPQQQEQVPLRLACAAAMCTSKRRPARRRQRALLQPCKRRATPAPQMDTMMISTRAATGLPNTTSRQDLDPSSQAREASGRDIRPRQQSPRAKKSWCMRSESMPPRYRSSLGVTASVTSPFSKSLSVRARCASLKSNNCSTRRL
jgi:hypothetical protein